MNEMQLPAPPLERPRRRRLAPIGFLVSGLLAGGVLAGTQIAGAAVPARRCSPAPRRTVTKAALAEVPGATVIRVETDSNGAAYEAHLQERDGSFVTVKLDKDFDVTDTEDGFGPGRPWAAPSSGSD
jgi:hypothetical protein